MLVHCLWILMFFCFGCCLGSILNMLFFKLTTREDILFSQPKCGVCKHPLFHLDMLPVIGWFRLKGKCRYCQARIPKQHVILELCGGLLAILLLYRFM